MHTENMGKGGRGGRNQRKRAKRNVDCFEGEEMKGKKHGVEEGEQLPV